jgi:DNA-binding transcriptional LysR family regulator
MFRAVVEYGGFNQASQGINKSQSSIHHAVHKIEDALGVKLFKVEGRKTQVTPSGEMILRRANYLLDEAAKVEAVGQTLGKGIETELKIAVDEIFPQQLLYKVLDATSKQFPMLRIELMESILTGAKELLNNSEVDIAISPFTVRDGFNEELCQIEFVAVAHPSHDLHAISRNLTLEDLKSQRQIVVRDSAIVKRQDDGWLGSNQRWTVGHMQTSIDIICNGLGFAWLPVSSITSQLNDGTLKPLKLEQGGKRTTQLHLIFSDGDRLGPAATTFIAQLRVQCINQPAAGIG